MKTKKGKPRIKKVDVKPEATKGKSLIHKGFYVQFVVGFAMSVTACV